MRFGYLIGQDVGSGGDPAATVGEALAEARAAEAAGFSGVFVSEHHGASSAYLPAMALLYLLAHETRRVDVGAAVLLLSLAQPARVAEEVALLDHVAGGRVVLGVGAGYQPQDFAAFGIPPDRPGTRMEEAVEILRSLWSGRELDHAGAAYRLRATTFPPPLTPGGPPIWIGGRSVAGVRRAARIGDAWLLDATPTRPGFRPWHDHYVQACCAAGRPPRTAVLRDGWLDLGGRLDDEYRESVLASHQIKLAHGVYDVDRELARRVPSSVTFEDLARERWLTGNAEAIDRELGAWEDELGVDYVLLRVRSLGRPSHEAALAQIEAFGEQVIAPRVRQTATNREGP